MLGAVGYAVLFEVCGRHVHIDRYDVHADIIPVPVEYGWIGDNPTPSGFGMAASILSLFDPVGFAALSGGGFSTIASIHSIYSFFINRHADHLLFGGLW